MYNFVKTKNFKIILVVLVFLVLISLAASLIPAAKALMLPSDCNECVRDDNDPNDWHYIRYKELDGHSALQIAWDFGTTAIGANPHASLATIAAEIYKMPTAEFQWTTGATEETSWSIWRAASEMYKVMKIVGIALVFLYFLIEILDEVQADNFNFEHLIKKLITLAVALIVIQQGPDIFTTIGEWGDHMIDVAADAVAEGNGNNPQYSLLRTFLVEAKEHGGFTSFIYATIALVTVIVDNIVSFLLMLIVLFVAYLICFSRLIEILVRFAFAPIGLAPLVSGGAKSAGMRYAKKFAAVCLQGAICTLAVGTVSIVSQYQSGLIASALGSLILPFTLIGFLMKSGRIAEDVVGV